METKEITYRVRLEAEDHDSMGYITYVFENLNCIDPDYQFIMCVRFPNWNQKAIELGDTGYLSIRYVIEGVDVWYDGKSFVPYKYTNLIFLKFVLEKKKIVGNEILID